MHVSDCLLTSEAQHFHARQGRRGTLRARPDRPAVQREVLRFGEVVDHTSPMLEGRDEAASEKRRVLGQESDADLVAEDDEMVVVIASGNRADETQRR